MLDSLSLGEFSFYYIVNKVSHCNVNITQSEANYNCFQGFKKLFKIVSAMTAALEEY